MEATGAWGAPAGGAPTPEGPRQHALAEAVPTSAQRARRLIEHLRGGVPLPPGEAPLMIGRAHLHSRVADLLELVATRGSRALVLTGDYGDGKTHSLRAIWHLAAERNFVVSEVSLNRETPLDRLDRAYPKLAENTYLPGATQPGIARLLTGITAGSEAAGRLLAFARDQLHPKIHAVVQNLIEGPSTEATEALLRDLTALTMPISELRRIHKGNFRETLAVGRFSAQRDVRDYFRLIDFLIRAAGFAGWVILFDEAELIARLGRGGRARAYANVGTLTGDALGCDHLLCVFALASNFYTTSARRHDPDACPAWLAARDQAEAAERCAAGLAAFDRAEHLEPLQTAHWGQVLQAVKDAHETAYGWSCPISGPAFAQALQGLTQTDTKVRTRLRVAIQWLDIFMEHGHAPHVRLLSLHEAGLDGGPWTEAAGGDAEVAAAAEETPAESNTD